MHRRHLLLGAAALTVLFASSLSSAAWAANAAEEFVSGKGMPDGFLFVTDPGKKFVASWGLLWNKTGETAYPSTFIVDKTSTIKFSKVSDNHAGRASAADVLAELKKLP